MMQERRGPCSKPVRAQVNTLELCEKRLSVLGVSYHSLTVAAQKHTSYPRSLVIFYYCVNAPQTIEQLRQEG